MIYDLWVLDCSPLWREEAIVEVHGCLANQVISEQVVVIPRFDFQGSGSRKLGLELKHLMELWIWFVQLILVLHVPHLLAEPDFKVGIGERADVSGSEVEPLKHVEAHNTILRVLQLMSQ